MNTNKLFECDICNKKYTSYSSRSHHIKNHHKSINKSNDGFHYCSVCNKKYKNLTSKLKHEKLCTIANNIINSTVNSTIKSNNNSSFNKTYNITINGFLGENFMILSNTELKDIFSSNMSCIIKFIELVNFNDNYIENHTIKNTSLSGKNISVIDKDTKKIKTMTKDNCFELLLCNTIDNLEKIVKLLKNKLITNTKYKELIELIQKTREYYFGLQSKKYISNYKKEINNLSYDYRHKILDTWKNIQLTYDDTDKTSIDESDDDSDDDDSDADGFLFKKNEGDLNFMEFIKK
jgi:hypothetical protein